VSAIRVLLIGGTSNVGKSSLAQALAARLGWQCVSTDTLGRHPGRPWPADGRAVPDHVVAHYRSLPVPDLTAAQLTHYDRMWPRIVSLIDGHAGDDRSDGLILEGSGVWPELIAELGDAGRASVRCAAIWLTASQQTIRTRIYAASNYAELTDDDRVLIDKFIGRTELYDTYLVAAAGQLGLPVIDVDSVPSLAGLVDHCLRVLGYDAAAL
jgi:2-phosphoglycerate kinase